MTKTDKLILDLAESRDMYKRALYLSCNRTMRVCQDNLRDKCPVRHSACMTGIPGRKDCALRMAAYFEKRAITRPVMPKPMGLGLRRTGFLPLFKDLLPSKRLKTNPEAKKEPGTSVSGL